MSAVDPTTPNRVVQLAERQAAEAESEAVWKRRPTELNWARLCADRDAVRQLLDGYAPMSDRDIVHRELSHLRQLEHGDG